MQDKQLISQLHPAGTYILSLVQAAERFSFYGVVSLLVLYLIHGVGFHNNQALNVLGGFLTLSFGMSLVGGYCGDQWVGYRHAVTYGNLLLTIGCFILVVNDMQFLYAGLALIACGIGFFKPNITSLLGTLYGENDPRRSRGYTIFYIGINLGGLVGVILCGLIAKQYDWHYAFVATGISGAIALFFFLSSYKLVKEHSDDYKLLHIKQRPPMQKHLIRSIVYIGVLIIAAGCDYLIQNNMVVGDILAGIGGASIAYLLYKAYKFHQHALQRIFGFLIITILYSLFYMLFMQLMTSINLYTDSNVNRMLGHFLVPTSLMISLNPTYVLILGPIILWVWKRLQQLDREPSAPAKFALSLLLMVVTFAILTLSAYYGMHHDGMTPMLFLIVAYFFLTVSELLIGPIGLSCVSTLAPPKLLSLMIGIWYLGTAAANYMGAFIAKFTSIPLGAKIHLTRVSISHVYTDEFFHLTIIAAIAFIVAFACIPMLKRLGVTDS